jgi:hypothetical protein
VAREIVMKAIGNEEDRVLPQIELGTKLISSFTQPVFVFASLWPSWLYAAKASGYMNLKVYVEDPKCGVEELVKVGMGEQNELLDWSQWKQRLQTHITSKNSEQPLILFQGPRDALIRVLDCLESLQGGLRRVEILAFLTNQRSEKKPSKKRQRLLGSLAVTPMAVLNHQMVGGVVDHAWT